MLGHRRVHLLKMDIEGAEFVVLELILALPGAADSGLPATGSELPFGIRPAGRPAAPRWSATRLRSCGSASGWSTARGRSS